MTSPFSSGDHGAEFLSAGQIRLGRILFQVGCGITLLYFSSGLLHLILGSSVYVRDVLMLLHLCACLVWLWQSGKARLFLGRAWFLALPAVFILPTLAYATYRVEGAAFIKWTVCWLDWVILGQLARTVLLGFETPLRIFFCIAAVLLLTDAGAGLYEARTGSYILHPEASTSAFGVQETKESHLKGHLRVKGLQRDVFSYSNLMGMSMVIGMLVFITQKALVTRIVSILWMLLFGVSLFQSGGRSAFFGVFGASLVTAGLLGLPHRTRRSYGIIVSVWLAVAILISIIGVGTLAESVGGSVMHGSDIGNSDSAYMRDANWRGITEAIKDLPIVLLSGAPVAALIDPAIDPIYHWADNQYLWLLYHTSIFGLGAVVVFFVNILRLSSRSDQEWARDGLIMFLMFVMGEAIARESMTFLGCMPLFVLCGWLGAGSDDNNDRNSRSSFGKSSSSQRSSSASQTSFAHRPTSATRTPSSRRSASTDPSQPVGGSSGSRSQDAAPRSEAEEFARRIRRAAARNQQKD